MPIIALVNSKGGVGKSTAAINLAAAYAHAGNRTILVDHDPRRGTSSRWRQTAEENGREEVSVVKVESGLPAVLDSLSQAYEAIIVDGPAYLDNANTVLISCADIVVIPIRPSQPDVWAVEAALGRIEDRQMLTGGIPLVYFLLSQAHADERVNASELKEITQFGHTVLKNQMVNRINYSRTVKHGTTVLSLPPADKARQEMLAIYEELNP